MALAADYRVMSTTARVGFPEVKLGIFPGYGGAVRLPRLIGLGESAQWIVSGSQKTAETALAQGAVDAVAQPEDLRDAALSLLQHAVANPAEWQERRQHARDSLGLPLESVIDLLAAPRSPGRKSLPHYPAAHDVVELLGACANLDRDRALAKEAERFGKTARSQAAAALVNIFINEQALKKISKQYAKDRAAGAEGGGSWRGGHGRRHRLSERIARRAGDFERRFGKGARNRHAGGEEAARQKVEQGG